ncbi:phosphate ABC transporter ATP-binding protein [Anaerobacillus sp. 1_MG-2023]|uniref:ABC transporter ATP-binding protein n=1 Tax=Anaerobacillus sp. 1_MG-2023 TaxID=3062655 RepID=UPI0026E41868|nr:phosphate ABC transporter ATP-binding protein [Anaerobacillus sp. 1_MG-2023]MDO6655127.1 phosphate ABC transporter ATP-binding protein [Anaerobacillus sp. 1_MG-2023]
MNKIIEVKNVNNERVSDIHFDMLEGSLTTIIGPSGAGKSSLLMLLNRLEDPDRGEILFKGKKLDEFPISQLRRNIGMVFQQAHLFNGTIEDNLKFGPLLEKKWNEKMGIQLLEKVQLPRDFLTKDVENLSGGEEQRVAFARTLANNPEVLLLDEVTSALDMRTVDWMEELLHTLVNEEGKTILMITHDLKQAKRLGSYTLFMNEGKIEEQGETKKMFQSPKSDALKHFLEG